jgi:hypothetical protein
MDPRLLESLKFGLALLSQVCVKGKNGRNERLPSWLFRPVILPIFAGKIP